jgi:predicted cobalt transporter CbtA
MRDLLVRGLVAGLLAGVLAFGFATLLGEPQVSRAVDVETQQARRDGRPEPPAVVSRSVQKTFGLGTATLFVGTAFGGLFALAFAVVNGRLSRQGPRATAALVAAAGFCSVHLVPFLKYPANPPGVGRPETIGHRTALYFVMIAFSVVAMVGAVLLGRRLVERLGPWNAALAGAGAFAVAVMAAFVVMPGVDEVPGSFPADVLWRFRVASLGTQFVLWTAIGLIFGALAEHRLAGERRAAVGVRRAQE